MNIFNVEIENIDTRDCPDFVDAFISYAEHENGKPLTDDELDQVNEDSELVCHHTLEQFF